MSSYPALDTNPSPKWHLADLLLLLIVFTLLVGLVQLLNKIQTSLERRFGRTNKDTGKDEKKGNTVQTPKAKDQQQPLPDLNVAIRDLRLAVRAHGARAEVAIKLE